MSSRKKRRATAGQASMPRRRGWLPWAIALTAVALLILAVRPKPKVADASGTADDAPVDATTSAAAAPAAPPFVVTTLDGRVVSDDQLRGKVALVNFWATWCPPCRAEMPGFEAVYKRYAGSDFVVLGVSMDVGSSAGVERFLAEQRITYPVAMAAGTIVRNFGGANFLPNSFLIDRQGRIRREVRGMYDARLLASDVEQLLAERDVAVGEGAGAR